MIQNPYEYVCCLNCRPQPEHPWGALRPPAGRPRAEHAAGELGAGGRGGRRAEGPAPGARGGGSGGARRAAGRPPRLHLPRGVGRADELPGECQCHEILVQPFVTMTSTS